VVNRLDSSSVPGRAVAPGCGIQAAPFEGVADRTEISGPGRHQRHRQRPGFQVPPRECRVAQIGAAEVVQPRALTVLGEQLLQLVIWAPFGEFWYPVGTSPRRGVVKELFEEHSRVGERAGTSLGLSPGSRPSLIV